MSGVRHMAASGVTRVCKQNKASVALSTGSLPAWGMRTKGACPCLAVPWEDFHALPAGGCKAPAGGGHEAGIPSPGLATGQIHVRISPDPARSRRLRFTGTCASRGRRLETLGGARGQGLQAGAPQPSGLPSVFGRVHARGVDDCLEREGPSDDAARTDEEALGAVFRQAHAEEGIKRESCQRVRRYDAPAKGEVLRGGEENM